MKAFWVYVLLCRDGTYYTGMTSSIRQRIAQHHDGAFPDCYTFERRPLTLVHVSQFGTAIEAITAEKLLKKWSHAKKRAFVRGDWAELRRLSRRRSAIARAGESGKAQR